MSLSETGIFGCYQAGGGMLTWFANITGLRVFVIEDKNGSIHDEFHYFTTYEYKKQCKSCSSLPHHCTKFSRLQPDGYTMIGVYVIYMKNVEYTHTATVFYSKTPYLQVGEDIPNVFCSIFEIYQEEWENQRLKNRLMR